LEAFQQLLRALPVDTGMAFVLLQHLDPLHESALTNILSGATNMPVVTVDNAMEVAPNHVYVLPPNAMMVLSAGALHLTPRESGMYLPLDTFFNCLPPSRAAAQSGSFCRVMLPTAARV
jgi:two-component system CheB/CheR fusion protein